MRSPNYFLSIDIKYQMHSSADVSNDCILLKCNFRTDGAPVNESSKDSFWPKLVIINELPENLRFRHSLLAGLWIGKKEPSPEMMNTYIKSFVEQLNELGTAGFTLTIDGKSVRFLLRPLVCTVDSVARPVLQNRVQFNGNYGCSWCKSVGVYKFGCMRFLMKETEPRS